MKNKAKHLLAALCILALPASSSAQGFPFTEYYLRMGTETVIPNLVEGDRLFVPVTPSRSYCCELWGVGVNDEYPGALGFMNPVFNGAARGHSAPALNSQSNSSRLCFLNRYFGRPTQAYTVLTVALASGETSVQCYETTLFGSYNTMATDFNFLELTSTLSGHALNNQLYVEIEGRRANVPHRPFTRSLIIEAGQRVDIDLHSIVGKDFGPIVIRHNGPKGALQARTGQYKLRSQEPLDFEPVSVIEFRGQE